MADYESAYWASALTGGGTGALDALDGDSLQGGDVCFVVTDTYVYVYELDAAIGGAESSPTKITPDANAGTKRWVLRSYYTGNIDHGDLSGLTTGDDHTQYSLADGSRAYTAPVAGVTPVADADLATKSYVDTTLTTLSGNLQTSITLYSDHGNLSGLTDDDHTQYIRVDGTRALTGTLSGVDPTASAHLVTKDYVDTRLFGTVKTSEVTLSSGSSSATISYGSNFDDTTYYLVTTLHNEVDTNPAIYDCVITETTVSGFTVEFIGQLESANYTLNYFATTGSGISGAGGINHGTLAGLSDNDHPQYLQRDGSNAVTGHILPYASGTINLGSEAYPYNKIWALTSSVDHGELDGLADDDHTQYHNDTRGDARYFTQAAAISYFATPTQVTYELLNTNGDVGTSAGQLAIGNHTHDSRYYTESEIDVIIAGVESGSLADVVDDLTPQLGGNLDCNQFSVVLTSAATNNQGYSGLLATMTVDANTIGFGSALHLDTDGNWIEADANDATAMPCKALAAQTGTGSKLVLMRGFIRNDSWNWTPGGPIYVSTNVGTLTQTTPSTTGELIQVVGWATHADRMWFAPDEPYMEVA